MNCRQQINTSNKSEMTTKQQQQELFNELAEKMMSGEITCNQAVATYNKATGVQQQDDEESEDYEFECEYCDKGGYEDQAGAVVKSAFANGDWSEIVGWCNESHYQKWLKRQARKGIEVEEHLKDPKQVQFLEKVKVVATLMGRTTEIHMDPKKWGL